MGVIAYVILSRWFCILKDFLLLLASYFLSVLRDGSLIIFPLHALCGMTINIVVILSVPWHEFGLFFCAFVFISSPALRNSPVFCSLTVIVVLCTSGMNLIVRPPCYAVLYWSLSIRLGENHKNTSQNFVAKARETKYVVETLVSKMIWN